MAKDNDRGRGQTRGRLGPSRLEALKGRVPYMPRRQRQSAEPKKSLGTSEVAKSESKAAMGSGGTAPPSLQGTPRIRPKTPNTDIAAGQ